MAKSRSKPGAPFLRVINNADFVDKVEEEAKALVDRLIGEYSTMSKKTGATFRYSIDVPSFPANDKVIDRVVAIFANLNWSCEPTEYQCAGGRAGAFWLQPPHNWQPGA
ncbi:MAG: hypothetical protein EKK48_13025 [Candidatus Melainabacteria bacterium]|nr:MAG: hypothetical protein EKK48_13025 [Candidatus Melainabacteria bacterium]